MAMEIFLSQFRNIEGSTYQERQKNLNTFGGTLELTDDGLAEFFGGLIPTTDEQHVFKIDLLVQKRRYGELLDELKCGKPEIVGRILKCYALFDNVKIAPEVLVDDLFPQLSFSTKKKVLNRICKTLKDEQLSDEYFRLIDDKYGLRMAEILIPACSVDLIKDKIERVNLKLSARHLFDVFKRDNNFLVYYFDVCKRNNKRINFNEEYSNVLKELYKTNQDLFWKLNKTYKFDVKIGRRATKKLISTNESILNDPKNCLNLFTTKKLFNYIKNDDKLDKFILNLYPDSISEYLNENWQCRHERFFKHIQESKRFELTEKVFKRKYNADILSFYNDLSDRFLEIIPENLRDPIAEKLNEERDTEVYNYLLSTEKAFNLFKCQLERTSSSTKRSEILIELYKMVNLNKSEGLLLDILEYVHDRFRNDTKSVFAFLKELANWRNLGGLSERHWFFINKLLLILKSKNPNFFGDGGYFVSYCDHLINNGKELDSFIIDSFKKTLYFPQYAYIVINDKRSKNLKTILEKISKHLPSCDENLHTYKTYCGVFCNSLLFYNKTNKRNKIPVLEYVDIIESIEAYYSYDILRYCMAKHKNEKKFQELFWKQLSEVYSGTFTENEFLWFLKNNPGILKENLEKLLFQMNNPIYKTSKRLKSLFKKYATKEIREEIVNLSRTKITKDNLMKCELLLCFLSCTDQEEFFKCAHPFLPPKDGKVTDETTPIKIQLEKMVIKNYVNVNSLEHVLKISADYLKFALSPLYKMLYHTKENEVEDVLSKILKSPVSQRKHALLLARHLLRNEKSVSFLNIDENNSSIKNIIFKKSLELYTETQKDELWEIALKRFDDVDPMDVGIHEVLIKYLKRINRKYLDDYFIATCQALEKSSLKQIKNMITILIKAIPHDAFDLLNIDLIKKSIESILRKNVEFNTKDDSFWNFIIYSNPDRAQILIKFTFENLKEIIKRPKIDYKQLSKKEKELINHLILSFNDKLIKIHEGEKEKRESNERNTELGEIYEKYWLEFLCDSFQDIYTKSVLNLRFSLAYFKTENAEMFAQLIKELIKEIINTYDVSVVPDVSQHLKAFLDLVKLKTEDILNIVNRLIIGDDYFNYIVIVYLLPSQFPAKDNKYCKWLSVTENIENYINNEKVGFKGIKYYYERYLEDNEAFCTNNKQRFYDDPLLY